MTTTAEIMMLCGSLRSGSSNSALLRTAQTLIPGSFLTFFYDGMSTLPHFNPDDDRDPLNPAVAELRRRIDGAGAILICTPEYAGALPGSFKNLLDWTVGGTEIGDKPTAWINVSASSTQAADAHASLRKVLNYTDADIVEAACAHIPVHRGMIEEGLVVDAEARERLTASLAELIARIDQAGIGTPHQLATPLST